MHVAILSQNTELSIFLNQTVCCLDIYLFSSYKVSHCWIAGESLTDETLMCFSKVNFWGGRVKSGLSVTHLTLSLLLAGKVVLHNKVSRAFFFFFIRIYFFSNLGEQSSWALTRLSTQMLQRPGKQSATVQPRVCREACGDAAPLSWRAKETRHSTTKHTHLLLTIVRAHQP